MSHHPASTTHPVVLLDTSPPRPQPSAHPTSSEVIVLDNSPRSNRSVVTDSSPNTMTHSSPIVVDEHPPKRRRRDNPAALPVHPRATSPPHTTPPVIVVDDEDTSDPDTPPSLTISSLLPSAAPTPTAAPRTHVRLPRINTTRNLRMQDDVIEMSATGPTVNRTPLSAQTPSAHHTRLPIPPTRTHHTSMPPLFSFDQRTTMAPEVSAPTLPTARRCPRTTNPNTRDTQPTPRVNIASNTSNPRTSIFPLPLPEQALPSTGRRATRVNRRVTFADTVPQDVLRHAARASTLGLMRDLESGIGRTARASTRLRSHEAEPLIQVVSGPAVFFDSHHDATPTSAPSHTSNSHTGQRDPRQSSFPHINVSARRNQGPTVTQGHASRSSHPELSRAGVHRTNGLPGQGMSRAYAQQLNAMHAASNGMPLQEDGASFVAQNPASRASAASGSISHTPMIVRAHIRSTSGAPRSVASTARAAVAVAEATQATAARFPAGLALSANQNQLSYGAGPGFSIASSRGAGPGRRSSQERHAIARTVARRRSQTLRRMQHRLRIIGSVPTGIEIQYFHGIPGDGPLDYEQLIRLDEQLIRDKNRADQTQIDSLPVRSATKEDKEIRCCICMCDVEEGEELRVLPCSHKYHKTCIDEWLTYNGCCPVDKKRIAQRSPRRTRSPQ